MEGEGRTLSPDEMAAISPSWRGIPDPSIEDGMAEDDLGRLEGADRPGRREVQLVGDDLFVTNP